MFDPIFSLIPWLVICFYMFLISAHVSVEQINIDLK
jgi:hypothetical protein